MQRIIKAWALAMCLGLLGCHTCDVCDDCGDSIPAHYPVKKVKGAGCGGCGGGVVQPVPAKTVTLIPETAK